MIPKRAFFYWSEPVLPWLRFLTLVSFRKFHPDWELTLYSPQPNVEVVGGSLAEVDVALALDEITPSDAGPAPRSDMLRWHLLAEHGGLFADTDILFLKNVEPLLYPEADAILTLDGGTPGPGGKVSIGVVAGRQGSLFYRRLFDMAREVIHHSNDYQRVGSKLIQGAWHTITKDQVVANIPFWAFYRGSLDRDVVQLWVSRDSQQLAFGPREYALHWYGGSRVTRPQIAQYTPESVLQLNTWVAAAARQVVGPTS